MFPSGGDMILSEMGTEHFPHVVVHSLLTYFYAKDRSVKDFVLTLLGDKGVRFPVVNEGRNFSLALPTNQKLLASPYCNIYILTSIDTLVFLHAIDGLKRSIHQGDLKIVQLYKTCTLIALCIQVVLNAWCQSFINAKSWRLPTETGPYPCYNDSQACFLFLSERN